MRVDVACGDGLERLNKELQIPPLLTYDSEAAPWLPPPKAVARCEPW